MTTGSRILMVIPTLGERISFFRDSLESVRGQAVDVDIVVVAPPAATEARELAESYGASILDDPGTPAGAINSGIALTLSRQEFVAWLGDDDLLAPESLARTTSLLDANAAAVLAFGACRYIDSEDRPLWVSRAGLWAERLLLWGPDLIPQPGMLVRASAWQKIGGLDENLALAFDLDLLLRLRHEGTFVATNRVVSCFRWHSTSLTASNRTRNLHESELVKRRYLKPVYHPLARLWEPIVRLATRLAAWRLHRRVHRMATSKPAA